MLVPELCAQDINRGIGLNFGVASYHAREELVNSNLYKGSLFTFFNPEYYSINSRSVFSVQLLFNNTALTRDEPSFYQADFLDVEINIEYLKRVAQLKENLTWFVGLGYNPHVKFYDQVSSNDSRQFFESTLVNISINTLLEWRKERYSLYLKGLLSAYNLWTKSIPIDADLSSYDFQSQVIGQFAQFRFNLYGLIPMGTRWQLKPEFEFNYYGYDFNDIMETEILKQAWTVGIYYKL